MTGTVFGSLDSAKAQTDKTSEQMANTTICDTLLDCRNDLITDGGYDFCTDECLFKLLGHEHDAEGKDLGQFEVNGRGVYKRILLHRL
jgi:hypothetical protein